MELFTTATTFNFAKMMLPKLFKSLMNIKRERHDELDKISDVFGDPIELAKYYIEPDCQQFNPADYEDESSHVVREPIFSRLQHFFNAVSVSGGNQLFILADAGMGKTSVLVMLKLAHLNSFWPKNKNCVLLKIGEATIANIREVKSKRNTILLLDALDEDPAIWGRTISRLSELLSETKNFFRVIITCRTQFFSGGEDPFNRRGQVEVSGYVCPSIYLSLFNDDQVVKYCKKRFPFSEEMIMKSRKILSQMQSLRLRPMLLAHIEDIIESEDHEWTVYSLYNALVTAWLNREIRKMSEFRKNPPSAKTLRLACKKYAIKLSNERKRSISAIKFHEFVQGDIIVKSIETMEIGGRSLLNMNSDGEFRFSHYTVQEFLLADAIINNEIPSYCNKFVSTNQLIEFIISFFDSSKLEIRQNTSLSILDMSGLNLENYNLSFFKISDGLFKNAILKNANLENTDLSGANLTGANISGANLKETNFNAADLTGANLSGADLTLINISEAILSRANLSSANLSGINLSGKDLIGVDFRKANLSNANLSKAILQGADFSGANLKETNFNAADLTGANLSGADLTLINISEAILSRANLTGANLSGINLSGKDLNGVDFRGADLSNANLTDSNLNSTNFYETNLSYANLKNCELKNSNFKKSNFTNAIFENIVVLNTDFDQVKPDEIAIILQGLNVSQN